MGKLRLSKEERRWLRLLSTLNEAQRRWYVADKALDLGRGGITRLSAVTGMSRTTIQSPGHGRWIPTRFSVLAEVAGSRPGRVGVG